MAITIRKGETDDAGECGRICYEAFRAIAQAHNYPPDFPSVEIAQGLMRMILGHPGFYGVVAEQNGKIIGSNFLDERNSISGVGPITVDPAVQNTGTGASLMRAVMERSAERKFAGIRLVQTAYHCRSLSLYSKLGFDIREHLSCFQGRPIGQTLPGYNVSAATEDDFSACNALCLSIHGHHRGGELTDAIKQGTARVVERSGRIRGYTTQIAFFGHAIGETTDDLKALIGAADAFVGPGFLVPSRNSALMRWCLGNGLRVVHMDTLMTIGLYNEPKGAYLPAIHY
jgi:GNAT superfamily N-acetyltransferase